MGSNPQQGFSTIFDARGVHLRTSNASDGPEFSMHLATYGCAASPGTAAARVPHTAAAANRAEYSHDGGVTEWYLNGPIGVEQGFTIERDLDVRHMAKRVR